MPEPENQAQGGNPGEPQGGQPDLMGYKSVEDLVAAKKASDQEAKRLHGEYQKTQQQLAQVLPLVTERMNSDHKSPYDRLAEYGVPQNELREVIQQEARTLLREELAPLAAAGSARESIMAEYPDFVKHEPHMNRFLKENPEVQQQYQWALQNARQNPDQARVAMEWAYLKYGERARSQAGGSQPRSEDPAAAAIPSGSSQGRAPDTEADAERLKMAAEYGQKFGDWRPYTRERLKGVIPDSHFQG